MSDNYKFDVTGAPLAKALDLAAATQGHKVKGWRVDKEGARLVLYWAESPKAQTLPAPLDGDAIVTFVKAWLDAVSYGAQPDHDGDNSKGARVYNEAWGHIDREWQAFVAIEPVWLMHGK